MNQIEIIQNQNRHTLISFLFSYPKMAVLQLNCFNQKPDNLRKKNRRKNLKKNEYKNEIKKKNTEDKTVKD